MRSLIVALILICLTASAQAQQKKEKAILAMNLELYSTTPRSYGPILAELSLESRVTQLIEGTLRLRFRDDQSQLLDLRVPDLVVSESGYTTMLVIPPLPDSADKGLSIDARFKTTDGNEIVLSSNDATTDELTLLISPSELRGMLVGMVVAEDKGDKSEARDFLARNINFDRYAWQPAQTSDDDSAQGYPRYGRFITTSTTLNASEIPDDPLALCAFNVLTILDEGLGQLKQNQLDAIVQWVRGGGRVFVVPDGQLGREHTGFLTELLSELPDPPAMATDSNRELICDGSLWAKAMCGLGRAVVISPKIRVKEVLERSDCRDLTAFLWDVRKDQWEAEAWKATQHQSQFDYGGYYIPLPTARADTSSFENLTTQLMPRNVRMVPLSLVGLLLAAYVFIVGPGDYLLLGLLKARKFTWIVFPLVTAAFTFGLVAISNHYMSTTETGGSIEINDIATGGVVVRQSRVALDFAPGSFERDDEAKRQIASSIDIKQAALDAGTYSGVRMDNFGNPVRPRLRRSDEGLSNQWVSGRFPRSYTTHRSLKQWEPQMSRTLSFQSTTAPDLGFNWDNPGPIWTPEGRSKLALQLRENKPSPEAWVLRTDKADRLAGLDYRALGGSEEALSHFSLSVINSISASQRNFLMYVSSVSPHGSGNFDDLAMLDTSDPDEMLLVVSWIENERQVVYRRLYQVSELKQQAGLEP